MPMVSKLGVNVAVIEQGRILLIQREDFEVWAMPGGDIEHGETLVNAAVREVKEETGIDVEITGFVGLYALPEWYSSVALFVATPINGELQPQSGESIDLRYWDANRLPEQMLWFQRHRIEHALAGHAGLFVQQDIPWNLPKKLTRKQLYARRDKSGLSRAEYVFETFGRDGTTVIKFDPLAEDTDAPPAPTAAEIAMTQATYTPEQYTAHLLAQVREVGRIGLN